MDEYTSIFFLYITAIMRYDYELLVYTNNSISKKKIMKNHQASTKRNNSLTSTNTVIRPNG